MYWSQLYTLSVAFCSGCRPSAMGLLSLKIDHVTGWFGLARGNPVLLAATGVPLPHASRTAAAPDRANAVPAVRLMKSRRDRVPEKRPRSRGWLIVRSSPPCTRAPGDPEV